MSTNNPFQPRNSQNIGRRGIFDTCEHSHPIPSGPNHYGQIPTCDQLGSPIFRWPIRTSGSGMDRILPTGAPNQSGCPAVISLSLSLSLPLLPPIHIHCVFMCVYTYLATYVDIYLQKRSILSVCIQECTHTHIYIYIHTYTSAHDTLAVTE